MKFSWIFCVLAVLLSAGCATRAPRISEPQPLVTYDDQGRVLDPDGIEVAPAPEGFQELPRAAFGGGVYLVVWQDFRNGKDLDVLAMRIAPEGRRLDPGPISIACVPLASFLDMMLEAISGRLSTVEVSLRSIYSSVPASTQEEPAVRLKSKFWGSAKPGSWFLLPSSHSRYMVGGTETPAWPPWILQL